MMYIMQDNQREELAYFAGLWDGEGTIGINSRYSPKWQGKMRQTDPGYAPYVRIGMNDERTIKSVYEYFRVGHYYPEKSYKGYRAMHRWDCRDQGGVRYVLECLLPFLRLKKPQAVLALKFLDECTRPEGVRIGIPFEEDTIKKRWDMFLQMKVLNGIDISEYSPATTKRRGRPLSVRVCDSLDSQVTARGESEAVCPPEMVSSP